MSFTVRVLSLLLFVASTLLLPAGHLSSGALAAEVVECSTTGLPAAKSFAVPPGQAAKLLHDAAVADVGADALAAETAITVTPLCGQALPVLDQGMTNVTAGPRH